MESWLTFADYQSQHPGASLTESQFELLARDAALFIENATRWCASLAQTDGEKALLSTCQAQLVELAAGVETGWDGVTSVNNHGYTESYASGMDVQKYLGEQQLAIVHRTLSAPATGCSTQATASTARPAADRRPSCAPLYRPTRRSL